MASWLECLTPDRVVRVRVLTRDIVLCSYINGYRQNAGGNPAMD